LTTLFKRTGLASDIADKVLFTSPTSASSSGLFLAAPRFLKASSRPEILGAAADTLRFEFGIETSGVAERFYAEILNEIESTNKASLRVIYSLTPLQSAVFQVLAKAGASYAPFEAGTMERYQALLTQLAPQSDLRADIPNVQQALAALQEKGLVWKASRGVYAVEDASLPELLL
jgi:hypothetical protein